MPEDKLVVDENGRVTGVNIPVAEMTPAAARKVQVGLQAGLNNNPGEIQRSIYREFSRVDPVSVKEQKIRRRLDYSKVWYYLNKARDPRRSGPKERAEFVMNLPAFWSTVCELGTPDERADAKHRILKFARKFDIDLPELPDPPQSGDEVRPVTPEEMVDDLGGTG